MIVANLSYAAMQSALSYGRFLARAVVSGFSSELQHRELSAPSLATSHCHSLHLITASSGVSKSVSAAQITPKWCYGDDAYFVAVHKTADVIGER